MTRVTISDLFTSSSAFPRKGYAHEFAPTRGNRMTSSLPRTIPRLLLEVVSVVFAVLVALAVDEWNEEREIRERASRARTSVIAELEGNREELRAGTVSSRAMADSALTILSHIRGGEEITGVGVQGSLPDFSDAAWETARVTGIVAYMDYDWVLQTARVYETQAITQELQRDLLSFFGTLVTRRPDEERYADLVGQLLMLNSMQAQLGAKIDSLLQVTRGGSDTH